MSAELLFLFCFVNVVAILTTGIVFLHHGYKSDENGKRNITFIEIGWIIIGCLSILVTGVLIFLAIETSWMVGFLFIILPLLVLVGLIITFSYGIYNLVVGYQRDKEGHFDITKITVGWINIGVNLIIITAIAVLLMMFMTGVFHISFM